MKRDNLFLFVRRTSCLLLAVSCCLLLLLGSADTFPQQQTPSPFPHGGVTLARMPGHSLVTPNERTAGTVILSS